MVRRICYLGDDSLSGAAIYLAGIMTRAGFAYDYVPSTESPGPSFMAQPYALYVVSDYPAARLRPEHFAHMVRSVHEGSGLLMIGGWESFHGRLGEYHRSPLAELLPVSMCQQDDRRNCAQPCLVAKAADHPIVEGLPWETPPGIGGFNLLTPKPEGTTLLEAVEFRVRLSGGEFHFVADRRWPLLVVGRCGQGRNAALATDVAPHWAGGLIDWGDRRVAVELPSGILEVGNWYVQLFRNLLDWTGRMTEW